MYRAESPLSNRHALASALQHSLAAGLLVIWWTVAKAERPSRERRVGVECAEAASGVVRPLPGLMGPPDTWKSTCIQVEGVERGPNVGL